MDQVIHMSLFTPLDFSTKKPKLHNHNSVASTDHDHSDNDNDDNNDRHSSHSIDMTDDQEARTSTTSAQSPCSQLRNILIMKSPAGVNELDSTSSPAADTTAALNLTMPQQASLQIGQNLISNSRLWSTSTNPNSTSTTNTIRTTCTSDSLVSSKLRRRKRSDSHSLSGGDDDDDNDSGRSRTSSTSPPSSNNSDLFSYGIKKSLPQPLSSTAAATSQLHFMNPSTNSSHSKSHYYQPNILTRHRQPPEQLQQLQLQQLHHSLQLNGSNFKMASSPKLARKSSPSKSQSPVHVVTPIATKLSPPMHHLNFSPYTAYSQASVAAAAAAAAAAGLSPIPMLSQSVPTSSFGLGPIQFQTTPSSLFSSTTMLTSPISSSIKSENSLLTTVGSNSLFSPSTTTSSAGGETFAASATATISSSGGKSKTTRPFKAYPKDPLTFPAVGLYGLPLNTPQPGSNESIIHQQSNHAYAEFRRQMLAQTHGKGSKRLNQNQQHHSQLPHPPHPGQQQQQQQPPNLLSPISIPTLTSPLSTAQQMQQIQQLLLASESPTNLSSSADMLNYRLSLIERGSPNVRMNGGGRPPRGRTTSSGADDSHSNSDEGFGSNEKSRLVNGSNKSDQQLKDEAYWERRRKNNEAAKRSRDARRAKEDEIAIRAAFLEQENLKLRFEVCTLKHEIEKLKSMILKR